MIPHGDPRVNRSAGIRRVFSCAALAPTRGGCYTERMQMRTVSIPEEYAGMTVEAVLQRVFSVSGSYLSRLKRRPRALLLNGAPVYTTRRLAPGDVLSFDPADGKKLAIRPIPFPLDVAYEDEWLIVVNKPKRFSVHPARDPAEPTLENALSAYFTGVDNPHPVSRLDKDTTGLLTVAKSGYVHSLMKTVQAEGRFSKTYLAITQGVPETAHFTIKEPIGVQPGSTYRRTVRADGAPNARCLKPAAAARSSGLFRIRAARISCGCTWRTQASRCSATGSTASGARRSTAPPFTRKRSRSRIRSRTSASS